MSLSRYSVEWPKRSFTTATIPPWKRRRTLSTDTSKIGTRIFRSILTFTENSATAGLSGGVTHFGFRLVDADDIDRAVAEVERAGGRLLRCGEFAPGIPYAYAADPDGC